MIIDFLRNLAQINRVDAPFKGKLSMLRTLNALTIKKTFSSRKDSVVSASFLDYRVFGYDFVNLDLLFREVFMREDYTFKSGKKNPVILDCGANIGSAVLYFKWKYPDSEITAIEASPAVFSLLEKNVSENQLKGVDLRNIALWDEETELSFFIGDPGTLLGSVHQQRGGAKETKVKATRLSGILRDMPEVDLVKMDIEGAEINVIKDLKESGMLGKPRQYIIEYHHNMGGERSKLSSFLKDFEDAGYNYLVRSFYTETDNFQDILIHFYKVD